MTLPPILILHIKRFTTNNFIEEKNPTIVNFPVKGVDMSSYVDPSFLLQNPGIGTTYDLMSNITHSSLSGTAREGTEWKTHVHTNGEGEGDEKWFEILDLNVEKIDWRMVFLGESYLQIWQRRSPSVTMNSLTRSVIGGKKEKGKTTREVMAEREKVKVREVRVAPITGGAANR